MNIWKQLTIEEVEQQLQKNPNAAKVFTWNYRIATEGFKQTNGILESAPEAMEHSTDFTVRFIPQNLTLMDGQWTEFDGSEDETDPQLQVENWEVVDKNQNFKVEFFADKDDTEAWKVVENIRYNHQVDWFDGMPEKDGHSFNRWVYVNEDETDENVYEFYFSDTITENKKVIAEWSVDPVYVHFLDEVYGDWDAAPEYYTTVKEPSERTTYGRVHLGWFEVTGHDEETGEEILAETAFDFSAPITRETTIRAKWVNAVAQRGDKGYTSLSAAVAEGDGYTIELLRDWTDSFKVSCINDKWGITA